MPGASGYQRASLGGALLLWAVLAQAERVAGVSPPLCPADRIDEQAQVESVTDGDTLRLSDGRKVRLIGINTPELAHDGRAAEPLAEEARLRLRRLVEASGHRIQLRLGEEPRDRYGRLLAHAFQADGDSIEALILREGLATRVAIPPNVWGLDCLSHAEDEARHAARGLWARPGYRTPISTRDLPDEAQGYMLLQGRVERVGGSRHAQWINLEGGVALKIEHDQLPLFRELDIHQLVGHRIEARGWLTRPGGRDPRIRLTHPSMLRVLD